jgi:hypothetical protein
MPAARGEEPRARVCPMRSSLRAAFVPRGPAAARPETSHYGCSPRGSSRRARHGPWPGNSLLRARGDPGAGSARTVPDVTIPRLRPGWVPMQHPVFESPPGNAALWRYMDLTRFIALLERRALFFAALRDLPDRFEGLVTPNLLAQARAMPGLLNSWELVRLMTYVNCWNEDASESMALWSLYASQAGGLAIRSS